MINATGLKKVFKKGTIDEKTALDGIDLAAAPGDFITIIGSNGAGKTTLLNLIAGTVPPDGGKSCSPATASLSCRNTAGPGTSAAYFRTP